MRWSGRAIVTPQKTGSVRNRARERLSVNVNVNVNVDVDVSQSEASEVCLR